MGNNRTSAPDVESQPGTRSPVPLSVVVPVYNESNNLEPFYREITLVLEKTDLPYEVIFVDDGSTDDSAAVLRRIAQEDARVRCLRFTRNFGQTAAMSAGFDHSTGDVIVPLDADLQNDPADIPRVLEKLDEGYDVVSCWRQNRRDSWTRVLPSRVANALISWIGGVKLHDYGCTLKGYRRHIIRRVRLYGEMHRFIPIFASWAGGRVTEIPVNHRSRRSGSSKYSLIRTFKVPLDLLTIKFLGSFSTKPMYLFGGLGLVAFAGGAILSAITLYQKFFEAVKAHRNPLLLLSVFLFLVGVQFLMFGLMCELIIRTYHESQNKPTYLLRDDDEEG